MKPHSQRSHAEQANEATQELRKSTKPHTAQANKAAQERRKPARPHNVNRASESERSKWRRKADRTNEATQGAGSQCRANQVNWASEKRKKANVVTQSESSQWNHADKDLQLELKNEADLSSHLWRCWAGQGAYLKRYSSFSSSLSPQ